MEKHPVRESVERLFQELRTCNGKSRLEASGLISSYRVVEGLKSAIKTTTLPSYLDLSWKQLNQEEIADVAVGLELQTISSPDTYLREYISGNFSETTEIYTDASSNTGTGRGGIAFYVPESNYRFGLRVSQFHSIGTLELVAIQLGINYALRMKSKNAIILSDSRRTVKALGRPILGDRRVSPLIQEVRVMIEKYNSLGLGQVSLIWIPGHLGIRGNEVADETAKNATALPIINDFKLLYTDIKGVVKRDFRHWRDVFWPHFPIWNSTNIYYRYINVKSPRP